MILHVDQGYIYFVEKKNTPIICLFLKCTSLLEVKKYGLYILTNKFTFVISELFKEANSRIIISERIMIPDLDL